MKKLLKVKSLSNLTTTICVCLLSLSVYAGSGTGTHDFGLDITQNESCELAKLKATKNLIENELGVVIQVNDIKTCVNDNCHLNSFKWTVPTGTEWRICFKTENSTPWSTWRPKRVCGIRSNTRSPISKRTSTDS